MRHRLSLILLMLAAANSACLAAVAPAWLRTWRAGLTYETNQVLAVSLDAQGNIVIGGSSTGAAGDYDYIVLKYDSAGRLLWNSRFASISNGNDLALGM